MLATRFAANRSLFCSSCTASNSSIILPLYLGRRHHLTEFCIISTDGDFGSRLPVQSQIRGVSTFPVSNKHQHKMVRCNESQMQRDGVEGFRRMAFKAAPSPISFSQGLWPVMVAAHWVACRKALILRQMSCLGSRTTHAFYSQLSGRQRGKDSFRHLWPGR